MLLLKAELKWRLLERKKERNHLELEDIETFLMLNEYPKMIKEWGARSNSKRSCENFLFKNGKFLYKSQRVVVISKQQQL